MTLLMRDREKYEDGLAAGLERGKIEGTIKILLKFGYSDEEIVSESENVNSEEINATPFEENNY